MIIKITHELQQALRGIPTKDEELSRLLPLLPDWLPGLAERGQVIIMERTDYEQIPAEAWAYFQVIKF